MEHLFASIVATFTAEILTVPFCTLKTICQVEHISNPVTAAIKLYKTNGIKGFYRATVPATVAQVYSTSSKWTLYKLLEDVNYSGKNRITNGIISGVLTTLVTHPIDAVRITMQRQLPVKETIRTTPNFFYKGYSKSLLKVIVGSACFFPIYETSKDLLKEYKLERRKTAFLSGILTAIVSTTIMQPLDYMKTRHISGLSFRGGNYYAGYLPNLFRIVPHFTITMFIIDMLTE
jgi:hypothetical protein